MYERIATADFFIALQLALIGVQLWCVVCAINRVARALERDDDQAKRKFIR